MKHRVAGMIEPHLELVFLMLSTESDNRFPPFIEKH